MPFKHQTTVFLLHHCIGVAILPQIDDFFSVNTLSRQFQCIINISYKFWHKFALEIAQNFKYKYSEVSKMTFK